MKFPWNRPLSQGAALEKEAERLGVSPHRTWTTTGDQTSLDEPELQRRGLAARTARFIALQTFAIEGALLLTSVAAIAHIAVSLWHSNRESEPIPADFMRTLYVVMD